jgi:aryl-alcohol dehydrogenase-like predicted oxidoreductase
MLGTAQWGSSYGITNQRGRLSDEVLEGITDSARTAGVSSLDTSGAYGDAEARLSTWAHEFRITTKVHGAGPRTIADQLGSSLRAMGVDRVHACLLHDWPTLAGEQATDAARELSKLQDDGLVERIGVSAYDEDDVVRADQIFDRLSVVQAPISILDRRLVESKAMRLLNERESEMQVRSIFLQGLLAQRSESVLGRHRDVLDFHSWCEGQGRSPIEVALSFVKGISWVSSVIVGVTSAEEMEQIGEAWQLDLTGTPEGCGSHDPALVDPRNWT